MRKLLLIVACFMCINSLLSQQLYLEAGKTISTFDYENSQSESLNNLQASNQTFIMLGYRKSIFFKDFFLNLKASYNSYGAIGSDRALDNYFEWDLSYLGVNVGFDYEFYKLGNFKFFAKVLGSTEFLIQGTQTLNNQVFNLSGHEDFDRPIYFLRGGLGIQYKISDNLSIFNQYTYGFSGTFERIQGDLKIRAHNFGLGLLINVSKNSALGNNYNNETIQNLQNELEKNSQKLIELEALSQKVNALETASLGKDKELLVKDKEIKALKAAILNAMLPYKGSELVLEKQLDRVKIVLDSDMLFKTGSWIITEEGEKNIEDLGQVLAENPDLEIMVEGHTDNLPFKGNGNIKNNWDLSVKRATAVIEILKKNSTINPQNLKAVGHGEFNPIRENNTEDGRAKNRRIEIILTPQLEELMNIIKN